MIKRGKMIWKVIDEFPDYKISNCGYIKRIKKIETK